MVKKENIFFKMLKFRSYILAFDGKKKCYFKILCPLNCTKLGKSNLWKQYCNHKNPLDLTITHKKLHEIERITERKGIEYKGECWGGAFILHSNNYRYNMTECLCSSLCIYAGITRLDSSHNSETPSSTNQLLGREDHALSAKHANIH